MGDVDWDNIKLPPGQDFGIESDYEVDEDDIELDSGFSATIVALGLPIAPAEKITKLESVVRKVLGRAGDLRDGSFHMPVDAEGGSRGFAFAEYDDAAGAARAVKEIDGFALDKRHTFRVCLFEDVERYAKVSDEYVPPPAASAQGHEGLHSWLTDPRGRDQFAVRYGNMTTVNWNDAKKNEPQLAYEREFWTDFFFEWSPRGNLMATTHRQGVALWGGPEFARLQKIAHEGVRFLQFSPAEEYMASLSVAEGKRGNKLSLRVFSTRTAALLRSFEGSEDDVIARGQPGWPLLKWSGGGFEEGGKGGFCAKVAPSGDAVQVYELPAMTLLDKKSLRLEGLVEFQWSPAGPIPGGPEGSAVLACFQREDASGNVPARVAIIEVPSRRELRQKNLFNVGEAKLHWHPQGKYLCVLVNKRSKTGKTSTPCIELFRVGERDVPMEVIELADKSHAVRGFAWEPRGDRFCLVHGDGPRLDVSFYTMDGPKKGGAPQCALVDTIKGRSCNALYWSPRGKNIVLATLGGSTGLLEFFNVGEMATMANEEHFMCVGGAWDPTGRYFASWVDTRASMENGYEIRNFCGTQIAKIPHEGFAQFSWRPRPPSLLTAEMEKEVQKNMKRYARRFEEEDAAILNEADAEVVRRRKDQDDAWKAWKERRSGIPEARAKYVAEHCAKLYDMGSFENTTVERDEVLSETTAVVEER